MDGVVYEDSQDDDGGFEAIQSAIIRRIAHSHHELLMKLGPDGVLEAAREVAEFATPVEEIGTSDVSAWVHMIEQDAGIESKEVTEERDIDDSEEVCVYCGDPRDDKLGCCEENHFISKKEFDEENGVNEAKDKVSYDPKTGKLTGWEHEGDWEKTKGKKKDPIGKIHHMSDVARRRTEKMAKDETLEEAFDRLVNEDFNSMAPGDSASPLSYAQRDATERYCNACDHIEEECICEDELTEDQMSEKIKTLIGQTVYVKSEGRMGKVLDIAPDFRNSVIVQVGNRETVSHINDLEAQSPGPVKQTLDLIRSITGGGPTAPRKAKPGAQVQQGLIPQTPDAFKKSVGIKR